MNKNYGDDILEFIKDFLKSSKNKNKWNQSEIKDFMDDKFDNDTSIYIFKFMKSENFINMGPIFNTGTNRVISSIELTTKGKSISKNPNKLDIYKPRRRFKLNILNFLIIICILVPVVIGLTSDPVFFLVSVAGVFISILDWLKSKESLKIDSYRI